MYDPKDGSDKVLTLPEHCSSVLLTTDPSSLVITTVKCVSGLCTADVALSFQHARQWSGVLFIHRCRFGHACCTQTVSLAVTPQAMIRGRRALL